MKIDRKVSPAETEADAGGETARSYRIESFRDLRRHWREDYLANNRGVFKPGFRAIATYRFGVWVDGIRPRFPRAALRIAYKMLFVYSRNVHGIEIYYTVKIGRRFRIGHQGGIVIHPRVTIGDDCFVRQNVTIGIARDGVPVSEVPVLGDRVEVGAGAVILSPARIGDDVVVGANAVVRREVPAGSVVLPPEPTIRPRRPRPDTPSP